MRWRILAAPGKIVMSEGHEDGEDIHAAGYTKTCWAVSAR